MGGEEKIKFPKKFEIRAKKGQTKKLNLGWHMDRKRIQSMHHPSMLVHWWVLVHFGHHITDEISKNKKKNYIELQ